MNTVSEAEIRDLEERSQNFKKEYLELLKKYKLEVVGLAGLSYDYPDTDLWLYDLNNNSLRTDFYKVTEDGAEFKL